MPNDVAIRISAQNEALAELEKTRAQVVALMQQLQSHGANVQQATRGATEGITAIRRGLDQLAERAAGIEGPVGRIASGLLRFGVSGEIGLGAVAGFAAIGEEIKSVTDFTNHLDEAFQSLSKHLAELSGVSGTPAVQLSQLGETQTSQPGLLARLAGRIGSAVNPVANLFGFSTDDIQQAFDQLDFAGQLTDQLGRGALGRRGASGRNKAVHDAGEKWAKDFIAGVDAEIHASLQDSRHILYALTHPAGPGDLRFAGGMALFSKSPLDRLLPKPGAPGYNPRNVFGSYEGYQGFQGLSSDVNNLGMTLADIGRADSGTHGINMQTLSAIMAAIFSGISSTKSGGFSGFLGGLGGLSTAAAGLKGAPALLGPLGVGLSGLGLLTSLFHHHHVTVDRFGDEAQRQMREALGLPLSVSYVIANSSGDLRQTARDLGRLSSRDGVTRIYG